MGDPDFIEVNPQRLALGIVVVALTCYAIGKAEGWERGYHQGRYDGRAELLAELRTLAQRAHAAAVAGD